LFHVKPDYTSLRIFGCACWPNLRPYNKHKLGFRSKQCAFLGYSNLHKCFKCLDTSSGQVYISRDVVFDENVFPFSNLHPNAGARLRKEILLLPTHLLNSSLGNEFVDGHVTNASNSANFHEDTQEITNVAEEGAGALFQGNLPATAAPADAPEEQSSADTQQLSKPHHADSSRRGENQSGESSSAQLPGGSSVDAGVLIGLRILPGISRSNTGD
jgi:hypothetical protein